VKEARVDPATQTALVIVPDYQLSLAIGKEGQNARLAARLTGWRIDIKSETQLAEEQRGGAGTPARSRTAAGAVPAATTVAAARSGPDPTPAPAPQLEPDPAQGGSAAEAEQEAAGAPSEEAAQT